MASLVKRPACPQKPIAGTIEPTLLDLFVADGIWMQSKLDPMPAPPYPQQVPTAPCFIACAGPNEMSTSVTVSVYQQIRQFPRLRLFHGSEILSYLGIRRGMVPIYLCLHRLKSYLTQIF